MRERETFQGEEKKSLPDDFSFFFLEVEMRDIFMGLTLNSFVNGVGSSIVDLRELHFTAKAAVFGRHLYH